MLELQNLINKIIDSEIQFLFLDRDGVINKKLDDDYVKTFSEFELLPNTNSSLMGLRPYFKRICVVTNQQGVGKGLMHLEDVEKIHKLWSQSFPSTQTIIDAFYIAPQLAAENHPNRKPGIGMLLDAKHDFPEIEFSKSLVIGDSESDIQMAKNAGAFSIGIGKKQNWKSMPDVWIDSIEQFYIELVN